MNDGSIHRSGTPVEPCVAVVIVTHRSEDQIAHCLASVERVSAWLAVETVVIDNASTDGTVALIRESFPHIELCANTENRGFAAACNQGIARSRAELVLLLNPDAMLQVGTLEALADYLDEHLNVGIVGPALEARSGNLQRDISATGRFPSFVQALYEYTRLGRWFPESPWVMDYFLVGFDRRSNRRVAMVQGACLLVRRDVMRQVGTLDERFFLYFEETDLCHRAANIGWETHYVGTVAASHLGGRSSRDGRPVAREFIRSMYRYHRKHYGLVEAAALWAILTPYHVLKALRMSLQAVWRRHDARLQADCRTVVGRCAAHFQILLGRP